MTTNVDATVISLTNKKTRLNRLLEATIDDRMNFNDIIFFSFYIVLTTLLGLIAPKGLDTNGTLGPMLGVHPLHLTDHNTGISLLLSSSAWVLLSPPIACRETRPTA